MNPYRRRWAGGALGPEATEDFMRQRKSVPGGDFGRIQNQHLVVRALADKIANQGMLTNPLKLDQLITAASRSRSTRAPTSVTWPWSTSSRPRYRSPPCPTRGATETDAGSSVVLDMARAEELFRAVRADRTAAWLAANSQERPTG